MVDFCRVSGDNVDVVFDTGQPGEWLAAAEMEAGVQVYFSRPETDADTFILERVSASLSPSTITVVTSDRALAASVAGHGAQVLAPLGFARLTRDLTDTVDDVAGAMSENKLEGVHEDAVDEWLEFFGCGGKGGV